MIFSIEGDMEIKNANAENTKSSEMMFRRRWKYGAEHKIKGFRSLLLHSCQFLTHRCVVLLIVLLSPLSLLLLHFANPRLLPNLFRSILSILTLKSHCNAS